MHDAGPVPTSCVLGLKEVESSPHFCRFIFVDYFVMSPFIIIFSSGMNGFCLLFFLLALPPTELEHS